MRSKKIIAAVIAVKSKLDLQKHTDILSFSGWLVTQSMTLVCISLDLLPYRKTVNIFVNRRSMLQKNTKLFSCLTNRLEPISRPYATIGTVTSDALIAYISTTVESSNPNFWDLWWDVWKSTKRGLRPSHLIPLLLLNEWSKHYWTCCRSG